ncbi:MAG: ergothioneine biosynthesis protein EgtB [Parvularculaceae bacterium]
MDRTQRQPRSERDDATAQIEKRFDDVRRTSLTLAEPLSPEDCSAQSMPDASPVKWHLAHTAWFFETFVLSPHVKGYRPFDGAFRDIFNSYYNAVGEQFSRGKRGLLTRPSMETVLAFRRHVDDAMDKTFIENQFDTEALSLIELGVNHEEQHQELMLTDLKHLFAQNPLLPVYREGWPLKRVSPRDVRFVGVEGGLKEIGAKKGGGFHFDNEGPRHRVFIEEFEIADRPVTNGEFIEFIEDGGYDRAELWLDAGFAYCRTAGWRAPLYWRDCGQGRRAFTLHGEVPIDLNAQVCHLSFYEAEAFARWAGARLPTEFEWELASALNEGERNFMESGALHPLASQRPSKDGAISQMFGDVWEWTRSDYAPYPGFAPADGAVGEYNGKFMSGQYVLRGGSCVTPAGHIRSTYRNFFPPEARWQFSGLRLARDLKKPTKSTRKTSFHALDTETNEDRAEIAEGLLRKSAEISPKYFYDVVGSQLFETITRLPEYYVPRAEAEIFCLRAIDIATAVRRMLGDGFQLIDLGAGSCEKAERLLPTLRPSRYVAIDISEDYLTGSLKRIQASFPDLAVEGVGMDFTRNFALPEHLSDRPSLIFYPGSSLGNFDEGTQLNLLNAARRASSETALLIGLDLVKDREVLEAAYDDPTGVTAAFNLNILNHVNRVLGSDFDPGLWRHIALYNDEASRIEMHLESEEAQIVSWPDGARRFEKGERILTELSRKWRQRDIVAMLDQAGFSAPAIWTDENEYFAVALAKG